MRRISGKNYISALMVAALLLTTACQKTPYSGKAESSCNFVQNSSHHRVSWKENLPVKFRVSKSVPKEARESIRQAVIQWNLISTHNIFQIIEWDAPERAEAGYADSRPTIYWLNDWEEDRSTEQARTTVVWSGYTIKDADIKINAHDFKFSYYGEDLKYSKVDLVSLVVHELGHALGFAHSHEPGSIMNPVLARGYDRREIHEISDLQSYSCEYGDQIVKPQVMAAALEESEVVATVEPEEAEATDEVVLNEDGAADDEIMENSASSI